MPPYIHTGLRCRWIHFLHFSLHSLFLPILLDLLFDCLQGCSQWGTGLLYLLVHCIYCHYPCDKCWSSWIVHGHPTDWGARGLHRWWCRDGGWGTWCLGSLGCLWGLGSLRCLRGVRRLGCVWGLHTQGWRGCSLDRVVVLGRSCAGHFGESLLGWRGRGSGIRGHI